MNGMKLLNTASFQRMEAALYTAEARQRVISNNIANAETPNFKRSELLFEEIIANTMNESNRLEGKRTNDRHIPIGVNRSIVPAAQLETDHLTAMNPTTNNNVDLDAEMTLLAKNQLNYNLYVQQVNHDLSMMRIAITGGK